MGLLPNILNDIVTDASGTCEIICKLSQKLETTDVDDIPYYPGR